LTIIAADAFVSAAIFSSPLSRRLIAAGQPLLSYSPSFISSLRFR